MPPYLRIEHARGGRSCGYLQFPQEHPDPARDREASWPVTRSAHVVIQSGVLGPVVPARQAITMGVHQTLPLNEPMDGGPI